MAEQSKPNTFGGGMVTDLDPGYQPKDTYFTGLNVRVITNGDKSFSLETIQGPERNVATNQYTLNSQDAFYSGTSEYTIHGAIVVDDYIITIESNNNPSGKEWGIAKWEVGPAAPNHNPWDLENNKKRQSGFIWNGTGLFDDDAGRIEIEATVETDDIHRIYCTDGISGLKSINVKDSSIASKTAEDFEAFKPTILALPVIDSINDSGGNLKCGSYSYVYRFYTEGQANYTDWSPISRPVNIPINSLSGNDSLTIKGGSSSDVSSHSIKVSIGSIPENYTNIEVASIHYVSLDVPTIEVIEKSPLVGTTHEFLHSGFEDGTVVSGGIADLLIFNRSWNTCKTLAQKDNRLFAGNLSHMPLNSTYKSIDAIASTMSGYKVKSYKAEWYGNGDHHTFVAQTGPAGFNEHRHKKCYDLKTPETDVSFYKFIPKNYGTAGSPKYILGAETPGFTNDDNDGFRITFQLESYLVDEISADSTSGSGFGADGYDSTIGNTERYNVVPFRVSDFDANYLNGVKGPSNPKWDSEFRSFRRGECYRFGIILIDKNGHQGFVHHIGDVKMPDGNDPNYWKLNADGDDEESNNHINNNWAPFGKQDTSNLAYHKKVHGYALIPRIDVRLPESITSVISGYRIVRAEVTTDDKVMITQGLASDIFHYDTTDTGNPVSGKIGIGGLSPTRLYVTGTNGGAVSQIQSGHESMVANNRSDGDNSGMIIETPDVTIGGLSYNLATGYHIQPSYLMMHRGQQSGANAPLGIIVNDGASVTESNPANHIHNGKWANHYKYSPVRLSEDFTELTGWSGNSFQSSQTSISSWANVRSCYTESSQVHNQKGQIDFAKTVVNQEVVSKSLTNFGKDFINAVAMDGGGNTTQQSSEHSITAGHNKLRGLDTYNSSTKLLVSIQGNWGGFQSAALKNSATSNPLIVGSDPAATDGNWNYSFPSTAPNYPVVGTVPGKWVVDLVRNTDDGNGGTNFEQYGGSNDSALQNTRYISCSAYVPVSDFTSQVSTVNITGGDTYCDYWSHLSTYKDTGNTYNTFVYAITVPLESSYNLAYRQGSYFGSSSTMTSTQEDSYTYNTSYSQNSSLKSYVQQPSTFSTNTIYENKIAASDPKIVGEPFDAWSTFRTNDFIDTLLRQGAVTNLANFNNKLYSVQERGIALLSINSRVLISGEGAAADIQIVAGTGDVIERFDYLTTQYGSQHFNNNLITPTGFYVVDVEKSEIIKVNEQGVTPLALSNGYKSFIIERTEDKTITINSDGNVGHLTEGVFTGYDSEFRECYFRIADDTYSAQDHSNEYFIISDLDGKLISKIAFKTIDDQSTDFKLFIPYKNRLYALAHQDYATGEGTDVVDSFHTLNKGVYQNFNVGFVVNDNASENKVFDSSEIITDQNTVFSSHILHDSFTKTDATYTVNTYPNMQRIREGVCRLPLRGDGNRHRGNWLKHTISYGQVLDGYYIDPNNDKKFNIFAVNTRYRKSR